MKKRLNIALWAIMLPATITAICFEELPVFLISLVVCATFVAWPWLSGPRFKKGDTVTFLPTTTVPHDFILNSVKDGLRRAQRYTVVAVNDENGLIKINGRDRWHHPGQFYLSN